MGRSLGRSHGGVALPLRCAVSTAPTRHRGRPVCHRVLAIRSRRLRLLHPLYGVQAALSFRDRCASERSCRPNRTLRLSGRVARHLPGNVPVDRASARAALPPTFPPALRKQVRYPGADARRRRLRAPTRHCAASGRCNAGAGIEA